MDVRKVALGVIQARGQTVIEPAIVTFGPDEADFLTRHVGKVRTVRDTTVRSRFRQGSNMPSLLDSLRTLDEQKFEASAKVLQDALVAAMATSTNASDCVFAVVHTADEIGEPGYITVLKLDAVVEAARMSVATGKVTLQVLKELLPEPGKLQKAFSWPDVRAVSDAIVVDASSAKYFQAAFDIEVSPRSLEAEANLTRTILEEVPPDRQHEALSKAVTLVGPLDDVLSELSLNGFPELQQAAREASESSQPAGLIRTNKVATKPLIWRADGIEVRVPPALMTNVKVAPDPERQGWQIIVSTRTQPEMGV
nr:hypothetical protein [Kibdelosporangium sp. MJ126-NF4]